MENLILAKDTSSGNSAYPYSVPKGLYYNMSMLKSEIRQIESYMLDNKAKIYDPFLNPEYYHSKKTWEEYASIHSIPGRSAIELYYTYFKDRCIYCHKKFRNDGEIAHTECRQINWYIDYFLSYGINTTARLSKTSLYAATNKRLKAYMGLFSSTDLFKRSNSNAEKNLNRSM